MPIISPFKRRFYDEAEEETFSGRDMLPFIASLYQETFEQEEKEESFKEETTTVDKGKAKRYFLPRVVKKVFKL